MSSLTLAGNQVTNNDMLIKGIIESIRNVNEFYQMLPFKGIHGKALAFNREMSESKYESEAEDISITQNKGWWILYKNEINR